MNAHHEYDPVQESCFHEACNESHQLIYCPVEAIDDNGDLGFVLEQLEYSLYDVATSSQSAITYEGKDGITTARRVYEQDFLPTEPGVVAGYRVQTTISHSVLNQPHREQYQVIAEWYITGEDSLSKKYRTEYCIEQFEEGPAMATITEIDPAVTLDYDTLEEGLSGELADRPMTGYDHEQLFNLLTDVTNLQAATQSGS